VFMYMYI